MARLVDERARTRRCGAQSGAARGEVKDRSGVGEDQTSRRATGWSLPALSLSLFHSRFFLLLRRCLPSLLGSSLFLPPRLRRSRPVSLSRALILFIFPRSCSSTMWFDDLRSLRSSSACYHTASPQCEIVRRKVASISVFAINLIN